jgi:GNAT superfamily N-acetyltransferase
MSLVRDGKACFVELHLVQGEQIMVLRILVIGVGQQGQRVLSKSIEIARGFADAYWLVVDPAHHAKRVAQELLQKQGAPGRVYATLDRAIQEFSATENDVRRLAFIEAPTPDHFEITKQIAPLADVTVCEKPACLLQEEFRQWEKLQQRLVAEGKLLRTHLTEVASSVVTSARSWLESHPEFHIDSATYFRGSDVAKHWDIRSGVKAHSFEDKSSHCVAAHLAITHPTGMQIDPDICVHEWVEGFVGQANATAMFQYNGSVVPVRFESSVVGVPKRWIQEANALELGKTFVANSVSTIRGQQVWSTDMRLGVLNLVHKEDGRRERLVLNFLGRKDSIQPWVCVSENGEWHDVPLPQGEPGGLGRIVSAAIELAVGRGAIRPGADPAFLDIPEEAMVIEFTVSLTTSLRERYGALVA